MGELIKITVSSYLFIYQTNRDENRKDSQYIKQKSPV